MFYSKHWLSSRMIAFALGIATLFFVTGWYQVLPTAHAAVLTQAQIDSVLSLLESFGTDQTVLNNVNSSLTGVPVVHGSRSEQRQEINELRRELKSAIKEFRTQLREGADNDEVLLLQEVLATDKDIYPEGLKTGYFGPLTKKAVTKFQLKHGVEGVGEVGPQTRRALNAFLKKDKKFGTISDKLLTKFEESDDERDNTNATNTDNGSEIGSGSEKVVVCHLSGGNALKGHTLKIGAPALNAHLAHGDTLGGCGEEVDDDGNDDGNGTTTVDIMAPIISNVTNEATSTSADISWNTDEESTSRVVYATSTPVTSSSGAMYITDSTLVTNHVISLSDLSASTTYYLVVSSSDALDNTATSTEHQFTTQ